MTAPVCHFHADKPATQHCQDCSATMCERCVRVNDALDIRCPSCHRRAQRQRRHGQIKFGLAVVCIIAGVVWWYQYATRPQRHGQHADAIRTSRAALVREPCDRARALDLVQNLYWAGDYRASLKAAHHFFDVCGEFSRLRWVTFEAHKMLSEFDAAFGEITALVEEHPNDKDFWVWRGLLYEERGMLEHAAADFRQVLSIEPRIGNIPFNLANVYERLGKHCEAIFPIDQYLFYYPQYRPDPGIQARLSKLHQRPECGDLQGNGSTILRFPPGAAAIPATARFNTKHIGTVIVDTGATFVTLSKAFAERMELAPHPEATILLETAAGIRSARLTTMDVIELQGTTARQVPVAILEEEGMHTDALLGLSFLSRFSIELDSAAGRLEIAARR